MRILILGLVLALMPCWCADKPEPTYERGVITAFSNAGPAMDHWIVIQTECCNYTIQNWRLFDKLTIGGSNGVRVTDKYMYIRVGKKEGKAKILKAEQR